MGSFYLKEECGWYSLEIRVVENAYIQIIFDTVK